MVRKGLKNLISSVLIAAMIIQQGNVAVASEPIDESQLLSQENEGLVLMGENGEETEESDEAGSEGITVTTIEEGAADEAGDSGQSGQTAEGEASDEGAGSGTEGDASDTSGDGASGDDTSVDDPMATEGEAITEEISDGSEEETIEETDADKESAEDTLEKAADGKDLLEEKRLPEGIKGMPEGYVLSRSQLEMKGSAREHDCLETLKDLVEGEDYVKDQVITLVDNDEDAQLIAEAYSGVVLDYSYGLATISLEDSGLSVYDAFTYCLDEDLELPFIEPNYLSSDIEPVEDVDMMLQSSKLMTAGTQVPADNGFSDRWWVDGIQDTFLNPESDGYQWHHDMINTFSAWGVTTGTSDITVAVIDSGITPGHYDFINDPGANNQPTVTQKYVYKELHPSTTESENDIIGHGTHVSGILAGRINGNLGAGVAPGVNILAMKASYGSRGNVEDASIIRAINYAASDKDESEGSGTRADIINLSLGSLTYSQSYETAVRNAYENGVTIVAAMGNDGNNTMNYPAAYDHVIGVCSVNASGNRSSFSNYGSWADISAPGSDIFSADMRDDDSYRTMDGTSMATPIVSGACALYMSAMGHVDPDTMERVLKKAVTGSAGYGTGTGIIDLAKLFDGDTTAPRITIKANDDFNVDESDDRTIVGEVEGGSTYTVSYDVASDSQISFTPLNFGGATEANNNTKIVYTTNGKAPSVFNGNVLNGEVAQGEITVSDLTGELTGRQKVTLKAAAVTGMGVMGKVSTLVFYVDPALETKAEALEDTVTVTIMDPPEKMVAGKSIKLQALVESSDETKSVSQKVVWRIVGYSGGDLSGARINSSNGTLTTVAGKLGTLNISCTTADGRATAYTAIQVTGTYPVKTIALSATRTNLTLDYGDYSEEVPEEEKTFISFINVSSLKDTANHDLLSDDTYTYLDKTFQWTSSNTAVVKVVSTDGSDEGPGAKVQAVGVGTARITCKVLDGSGKYARVTLKVGADANRKVQTIKLYEGTEVTQESVQITSKVLYAKEDTVQITAVQTCADGWENYIAPSWSSSNSKVVFCERDSENPNLVTLRPLAKGTANITCAALDGSGKKAVLKVTVIQHVDSIKVTGQKYVASGTSARFTASVLPANANNRGVIWDFADPDHPEDSQLSMTYDGVTIDASKGIVTVSKGIVYDGTILARAMAKDGAVDGDGNTIFGIYEFEIHDRASKVTAVIASDEGVDGINYSNVIATQKKGNYLNTTMIKAQPLDSTGAFNGAYVSFKSSNDKVATVESDSEDPNVAIVTAVGKGKAVITATAQDGSKKAASITITVIQLADEVAVTGQYNVALGTKATYKATVTPANTNNKKVKWYLTNSAGDIYPDGEGPEGVTLNSSNGVVVVDKQTATTGTEIGIVAVPLDNGSAPDSNPSKSEVFKFEISDAKTTSVGLYAGDDIDEYLKSVYNLPGYDGTKALSAFRLFDTDIVKENNLKENKIELTNKVFYTSNRQPVDISDQIYVQWASSNTKVAEVTVDSQGKATVEGIKAGTANITCTALDGSGKKATVRVTVIKPVSGITIEAANNIVDRGDYCDIAKGYSTVARVSVGSAYETPSISKVKWDYEYQFQVGAGFQSLESYLTQEYLDDYETAEEAQAQAQKVVTYCKNNRLFYSVSNGKVTPNSPAALKNSISKFEKISGIQNEDKSIYDYVAVLVKASATDGTGYYGTKRYLMREPVSKYKADSFDSRIDSEPMMTLTYEIKTNVDDYQGMRDLSISEPPEYVVTSSNPNVAFGSSVSKIGQTTKTYISTLTKGTATITITAQDGSNKKTTIKVYVR